MGTGLMLLPGCTTDQSPVMRIFEKIIVILKIAADWNNKCTFNIYNQNYGQEKAKKIFLSMRSKHEKNIIDNSDAFIAAKYNYQRISGKHI